MTIDLINDNRAENPLEVAFYLMVTLISLALIILVEGTFIDQFVYVISGVNISLSVWGQTMMNTVMSWVTYMYAIPTIFIIIVMVWGLKTVIKRKEYSAADQQYMNTEEY